VVDEVAQEQIFIRVLLFSPASHHSTNAAYSSPSSLGADKVALF
jgi:hypothetical protein